MKKIVDLLGDTDVLQLRNIDNTKLKTKKEAKLREQSEAFKLIEEALTNGTFL